MERENKVLIVDDDVELARMMSTSLTRHGFVTFLAFDGVEALSKIKSINPDLILLDAVMPQCGGLEVTKQLKENQETRLIPIIMITGMDDKEMKISGIEAGVDDFLTKPVDQEELLARARSLIRVKMLNDQLESMENVLYTLVNIIDAKDSYTRGHSERVTKYAMKLAETIGLSKENIDVLEKAAKLHDIGKIGVPEEILNKPSALTKEEFEEIKKHPIIGETICTPLKTFGPILRIIRHHHERYDGKGYPDGISGNGIPLEARIIAVADSYDAMASNRPYRNALEKNRILAIFNAGFNEQWDESLVRNFIKLIEGNRLV
ncbi:MAG: HD domain-containing phosphohydrolase [Candidatus Omnitrophota bacterium]